MSPDRPGQDDAAGELADPPIADDITDLEILRAILYGEPLRRAGQPQHHQLARAPGRTLH